MILREYQNDCLTAVRDRLDAGIQRQCAVLPTGAGKTVIFSHIPQINPGRTLILAHREELLKQAYNSIKRINPSLHVGIEQAEYYAEDHSDIVIASVQTFGKKESKRRERFYDFTNIICDEAHHATASSYRNIFEHYGFPCDGSNVAPPGKLLLGVTATPKRSDGVGLEKIFQEVVYSRSLRDMIESGYLVDIVSDKIVSNTSLDGIKTQMGDYAEGELGSRVNNEDRNHLVVNGYLQHANGKKAIVFCVNVEHTASLTQLFVRSGIKAEMVIGSTPADVRKAILWRYEQGITTVLVGCMVFTEGFDSPGVECVIMARPTRSQLIYIQQLGRGLRPLVNLTGIHTAWQRKEIIANSPKPHLHLLDVVDNCTKNSPIMLPTLFGLNKDIKLSGKPLLKAVQEVEDAMKEAPGLKADKVTDITKLQQLKADALRVNIWDTELPKEVKELSTLSWQKSEDQSYWITLNKFETLQLKENTLGQWDAVIESTAVYDNTVSDWILCDKKAEVLGHEPKLEDIFRRSDKYISNHYADKINLLDQKAKWKADPATEKQVNLLKKFQVPIMKKADGFYLIGATSDTYLTKGMASGITGKKIAERQRARL